jgi:NitT/TauT family transport system ATP-binding protein
MNAALSIRNVSKRYDGGVLAVDRWSLDVAAGEFVAIVGPSGCGKTTLLNAIAGFDGITEGTIDFDGTTIAGPGIKPKPSPQRAVVFQRSALLPWKTVAQNVAFGLGVQSREHPIRSLYRAKELLDRIGLRDVAHEYPARLSSGTLRRIEFVRAFVNDPPLLLLDEPFRALDTVTKSAMHEYLAHSLEEQRRTVLLVTHDITEAILLADRVVVSTARPAAVKRTFDIKLPRPRRSGITLRPEFELYRDAILGLVEAEARLAFESGELECV